MFIRARVFASMSGALAVVALTVPWCVVVEVVTWMTTMMMMNSFIRRVSFMVVVVVARGAVCVSLGVY